MPEQHNRKNYTLPPQKFNLVAHNKECTTPILIVCAYRKHQEQNCRFENEQQRLMLQSKKQKAKSKKQKAKSKKQKAKSKKQIKN